VNNRFYWKEHFVAVKKGENKSLAITRYIFSPIACFPKALYLMYRYPLKKSLFICYCIVSNLSTTYYRFLKSTIEQEYVFQKSIKYMNLFLSKSNQLLCLHIAVDRFLNVTLLLNPFLKHALTLDRFFFGRIVMRNSIQSPRLDYMRSTLLQSA